MAKIEIHDIQIERSNGSTKVKGRTTKNVPTVIVTKGHIQPLDFIQKGGKEVMIQPQGDNIAQYTKLYTYTQIHEDDRIVDVATGDRFRVMRVWHYYRAGTTIDHYRGLLILEES